MQRKRRGDRVSGGWYIAMESSIEVPPTIPPERNVNIAYFTRNLLVERVMLVQEWSPLLFAEAKKRDRLRKNLLFLLYYLLSIL